MKWSYSMSRIFKRCPRKWYFSQFVSNINSKDPFRNEAFYAKQLKSIYAWRGGIVDTVIEKKIVPALNAKNLPSLERILSYSMDLLERQLEFGVKQKYKEANLTKSNIGADYCAFYDLEYNGCLDDKLVEQAKNDVKVSLENLMNSELIKKIVQDNQYVIAQRSISFPLEDITVNCTPDMIVFFEEKPPLIIDWKVHAFAITDYWLQLGIYSLALSKSNIHRDFPDEIEKFIRDPTQIQIIEYQLLKNTVREHKISNENVGDILDYIYQTGSDMFRFIIGRRVSQTNINDIPTTLSPERCGRCNFKKMCWTERPVQKSLFEV